MKTVLLTGTIAPGKNTPVVSTNTLNSHTRDLWYMAGVLYYLTQSDFTHIVFCDNSDTQLSQFDVLNNIAARYGKCFEYLTFQGDFGAVEQYGYAYGEAEIIDYAFDHSAFLKQSDSWFKITGRYIYPTINQTIKDLEHFPCHFLNGLHATAFFSIQTAFFKVSNQVYKKYLYKKSLHFYKNFTGSGVVSLEKLWYRLLRKGFLYTMDQGRTTYIQYAIIHRDRINILTYLRKKLGILELGCIAKYMDRFFYWRSSVSKFVAQKSK